MSFLISSLEGNLTQQQAKHFSKRGGGRGGGGGGGGAYGVLASDFKWEG